MTLDDLFTKIAAKRLLDPSSGSVDDLDPLHAAAAEIERLRGETLEQARLLGMSGEREAKLVSEIERLRADNAIYEEQEIRMECWIEQRDAEIKLLRAALWRSAPPERKP
jgi:hypothetical protein